MLEDSLCNGIIVSLLIAGVLACYIYGQKFVRKVPAMYIDTFTNPYDIGTEDSFPDKARELVRDQINQCYKRETDILATENPDQTFVTTQVEFKDTYTVWFSKTLDHWKALISTTIVDGRYYEVTYNGIKDEWYVDTYKKESNVLVQGKK